MSTAVRSSLRGALTLLVFAVVCTALMSGTWLLTRDRVAANEAEVRVARLAEVLPGVRYDNDLLRDAAATPPQLAMALGQPHGATVYRARREDVVQAVALEVTAPDGYAGPIRLLLGIGRDGRVLALRVVDHKETPGLGDYIDAAKSDWARQFAGASLGQPTEVAWAVQRDGGAFDAVAGATVTPRAVVKAVKRALQAVESHHAWLFGKEQG